MMTYDLKDIVNQLEVFIAYTDCDGTLLFINQAAIKMYNLQSSDIIGLKFWQCPWWSLNEKPDNAINVKNAFTQALTNKKVTLELEIQSRWFKLLFIPKLSTKNNISHIVIEGCDITTQIRAETLLTASEYKYKTLFSESVEAYLIQDGTVCINSNKAAVELLGYDTIESILGLHPTDISPIEQENNQTSEDKGQEVRALAIKNGSHRCEWLILKKNGDTVSCELTLTYILLGSKDIFHVALRDITKQKKQQKQLELLAHYDPLTGLPNRTLFNHHFEQAVKQNNCSQKQIAVCFIDLDNFKAVNDNFGHQTGDKLLKVIANRLIEILKAEDSVSRQGGDEFAFILCDLKDSESYINIIQRVLKTISATYNIDGVTGNINASCGVTLYPKDNGDFDQLLRHADQAMYQAKLSGKNKYHLFNFNTEEYLQKKYTSQNEIKIALARQQLVLFYQPKVNMRTGNMVGAEALIRWLHPKEGLIGPVNFLPQIENTQIMVYVGEFVIEQALLQLNIWLNQGKNWKISINIDAYHFTQENFVARLKQSLDKYPDINSEYLEIEILETVAIDDIYLVSNIITQCQALGVSVSLDDFGTGYSSLSFLRALPVNTIKIDQTFVRDMLNDNEDRLLIEGIISLAKVFNKEIIAEGVESAEHGTVLIRLGCDLAQGYGIAKPMPSEEVYSWVNSYKADKSWSIWANSAWEMSNLPLITAQAEHIKWVQTIFNAIDNGYSNLPHHELIDHKRCQLGTWYYSHGKQHYGHLDSFKQLEVIHKNIHLVGRDIISCIDEGKKAKALDLSKVLLTLKSEVLDCLNILQQEVNF